MKKQKQVVRFDMKRLPFRQNAVLTVLAWILSFPEVWMRGLRIRKVNMKGLKPPYIMLNTHMAFLDFKVATAAIFPRRANNIVAIDGFIGREWLLRLVGCICKRKFTNDFVLVRQIDHVLKKNKDILIIYPEARYSLAGTTAVLPESLGKLVKLMNVPVVVLNMHGHYLNSPCWNLKKRGVPVRADMTQIIRADEIGALDYKQINDRIGAAFYYDEYRWQKDNHIRIKHKDNAKGLHKVLYKCPNCMTENKMNSEGVKLWCGHCGKEWVMSELGELSAVSGRTEFTHVPDWYEFERAEVRREIELGTYGFSDEAVIVDSLPNAKGYIRLGEARLSHGMDGFRLEGEFGGMPFMLRKTPESMYSCHIEYDYFGKGDCIDLSTIEDTYYIYPQIGNVAVTKIALATEELYKYDALAQSAVIKESAV